MHRLFALSVYRLEKKHRLRGSAANVFVASACKSFMLISLHISAFAGVALWIETLYCAGSGLYIIGSPVSRPPSCV